MRKLKRSECSILHLVLKKKWYDMIASGEKREEYRDVKDYYRTRISNFVRRGFGKKLIVGFSLGRKKADMFVKFCGCNIYRDCQQPEWGEPEGPHYVIALGSRVIVVDESEVK